MANEAGAEEKVERIQVTGSRISRTDMETASPVTVISSDSITKGGFSILHGTEIAGGNLVAGFSYTQRGEVIQSDRDFTPPGQSSVLPGSSLGGLVPDADGNFNERTESYDYTTSSYAQTPNKLYSLFSAFNKEIAQILSLP